MKRYLPTLLAGFIIGIIAAFSMPSNAHQINWWIPVVFIAGVATGRMVTEK